GPMVIACQAIDRSEKQISILDTGQRQNLSVVAGLEDLVGFQEVLPGQGTFIDRNTGLAQQLDHPLARNPIEEAAIGHRRVGGTVLSKPDIGSGELGYIAGGRSE